MKFSALITATLLVAVVGPPVSHGAAPDADPLLEHDVLPILTKQCMSCHGGLVSKAGLDLRTLPSMLRGGDSGAALVAGKPEQSELWIQIADGEMPKGEKKLSAEEKETIRKWIAAGLPTFAERHKEDAKPLLPASKKHEPRDVAKAIDQHIAARLDAAKVKPAPLATDAQFLRRVYLDLTGRVPTPDQAGAFLDDTSPDKHKLIDALLDSPHFGEQFGRTRREWIAPPELPSDMNSGKQPINETRELGTWFANQLNANHTWDKIVRDLLAIEGDIKKNPQGIFYGLIGQDAKVTPDGSARSVASLFMGVQLQCAQCHDDPYRDWSQAEFWSFAAFFGSVNGDFKKIDEKAGDPHITIPKSAFENAGDKHAVAFLRSDRKVEQKKREFRPLLIDWLTDKDNPYFAKAFANRMWFYLFARGIVNPVDDFRELNPPSHPGLMALLANEFTASNHDIKHLLRCLCNSQTYQRSSNVDATFSDAEASLQADLFGRARMRVVTADMLYDSLKQVYADPKLDLRTIEKGDGNTNGESAAVGDPLLEMHRQFGTNEEDATDFTHGIPQMLTLMNHPRLLEGSKAIDDYLKADPVPTPEQTIEWLYLGTLSRRPSPEELADAQQYVKEAKDSTQAFNDVLWMLINRSEFLLIR